MDINEQTFALLLERFDRVDQDNKDIKDAVNDHVKKDNEVHAVVTKHASYWSLLIAVGGPILIGLILAVVNKIWFH
jgi:hypothetical protein